MLLALVAEGSSAWWMIVVHCMPPVAPAVAVATVAAFGTAFAESASFVVVPAGFLVEGTVGNLVVVAHIPL